MKTKILLFIAFIITLSGCSSSKKIAYLQEAEQISQEALKQSLPPINYVVMPGDLIDIVVSGVNVESLKPFNRAELVRQLSGITNNTTNTQVSNTPMYYLVDNDGYIDFPVLGRIKIGGMNKSQINDYLQAELYPKYLNEKPAIDIRFKNFKVSVIGEVRSPGVYTAVNERMNILEAIAMAGDLNITGMRENLMLIRTNADGSRSVTRINLNDKSLILSPFFNLQQNDVIYVQPNSSRANQSWSIPPALSLVLSSVGTLISIATFIVTLSK